MHGEQKFAHHRPIRAGDRLVATTTIDAVRSVGGNDLLTTRVDLATAAVIAAGLAGIEEKLELEPAFEGNAYDDPEAPHVPTSLAEALDLWRSSDFARRTFGDDVVDHYANMAAVELAAYGRAVTDWERIRGFERL